MEKVVNVEIEKVENSSAEYGEINASGHRQELRRNFNLLSICSAAVTTGNSWVGVGGTIVK